MKKILVAASLCASAIAFAQPAHAPAWGARAKQASCRECGTVQEVRVIKRKGEGGAAGIVGGAVLGGLLGNQVGKGTGRTVATAGGAVAGAYVGNEVQKKVTSKTVWITKVHMTDGTVRTFEHDSKPAWKAGSSVRVDERNALVIR